ncbi:MAG: hypothetical protein JWO80_1393 [Bryobacterales bacterium]|nr:hypothetical protein [Bryobacterales bacterium]
MKRTLRTTAKLVHVWGGLTLGLLFCLMGLSGSGSVIVFRADLERALRPHWHAAGQNRPASPLLESEAAVRRRWPGATLLRVTLPDAPGEPYRYQIRANGVVFHVFCDAATGEILGVFDLPWLDWIIDFHHNLRLAGTGRQLTGLIGLGLFVASLTGLILWVIRNQPWTVLFRVGWRGPFRRRNFELHRTTGVFANVFLLILSATGISLAYPQTFRVAIETLTGTSAAPPRVSVHQSAMTQPLDAYIQAARSALPGSIVRELRFPSSARTPVTARMWCPGDFSMEGSNQVALDPATARVLSVDSAAALSIANRVTRSAPPLHYAEWGGPVIKLLWALVGITPSFLFISGFAIWRASNRARS